MDGAGGITALFADALADVQGSPELERILALPQRDPDAVAATIVHALTARLKTPGGSMTLRPLQALGICEAHDFGGLLGLFPVGGGKTLVTMLIPVVLAAARPVLLVPAKLMDKTLRDFADLAQHWKAHPNLQVVSYELISRRPELMDQLSPDLIMADECHKLKNTKAAVTKRVWRYMKANADTKFVALSGTVTKRSFRDWWHLQAAALPAGLHPLPRKWVEMAEWASAMDTKLSFPRPVGALSRLGGTTVQEVRTAFGDRLRMTPGVIVQHTQDVDASILLDTLDMKHKEITANAGEMRSVWETPDGDPFSEAADLWRHQREVANGFYYKWKEPGPLEWMECRRAFHKFVRETLKHSRKLDSMLQVARAHKDHPAIAEWRAIKDTFTPVTIPHWFTDDVINMAAKWADQSGGLVWVEQKAVGIRLECQLGLKYFGAQGLAADGTSIRDHKGPAAVSSIAVAEGFNLQHYFRNLILNATPSGLLWQQLMGRTHRFGQEADTVFFTVLTNVAEQMDGLRRAITDAEYIQATTGQAQKLCLADMAN